MCNDGVVALAPAVAGGSPLYRPDGAVYHRRLRSRGTGGRRNG